MMKRILICVLLFVCVSNLSAQTNTFPVTGNVGIGTTNPEYNLDVKGTFKAGGFTSNDADEWPNFVWYRDIGNSWDEGLIKHSSSKGVFGRSGFGIHMEQSREFGFWSTGWTPLFSVKGGSGDVFMKGNVGIGTTAPGARLDVYTDASNKIQLNSGYSDMYRQGNQMQIDAAFGNVAANGGSISSVNGISLGGAIGHRDLFINSSGNVGIGTTTPSEKLSVNGNIKTKKLIVTQNGWADYVFNDEYYLRPLSQVENFIKENKHLPDVPTAKDVEKNGVDVGEMQALLLKKIEELTLYMIEQNKKTEDLIKENNEMKLQLRKFQIQINEKSKD